MREKEESWVLFPDEKELPILIPIALGGAPLNYTFWRSRSSWLVVGLKNAFTDLEAETHARVIGIFVARLYHQKYL